ncbi:M3 family metallopeptidase [Novosphingobium album (ex Liu et al. 2023)]|uniref:M3 family metallopeptidase n=1 Tax=Novosphingobium album (ex Liu et al. 2023) TaxID=3031130 RepID=A0ABT5WQY8_9SPHN|nr:M3 family metallopeptidase [Novosphingobium album (ex Liu et al. 2023)]MDE8651403.1 M3 family metallopeptidase [Novosphingobium album (ex Liu et al. 2023)]
MSQTADAAPPPASARPSAGAGSYFAKDSDLPFHAPDFTKLTSADYQPAIEAGIAQARAEIEAIAANREAPTFANTLVALERGSRMLNRVMPVFGQLTSANTDDTLDATEKAVSPRLSALYDDMFLNDKLFQRVKAVYDQRAALALAGEDAMLLETTYAQFVHAGALLAPAQKEQLKAMNTQLAELETEFSQKLTEATAAKAPVFDSAEELAGLPAADLAAAKKRAEEKGMPGKYMIALVNTTQQPALSFLTNRAARRKLFEASLNRTSGGDQYDTTAIVARIADLRAKKAALLGLPNYATFAMYDRMVKQPGEAMTFMKGFVPALAATQAREAKMLADHASAEGDTAALAPWDWSFYAEQVRKAKYDLDESQIKPYFEVWRVLEDGVFYAANQFYGISFKRRTDIPVYHPTMRVYTVFDKDGSEMGLFYSDPFARPNKKGGAWMNNFVEQSSLIGDRPVVSNTLNITAPAEGEPALATWDDVSTMFHEFGHALHGLFAHQRYASLSGTNTARDFVEFPSQFNENFATVPAVLNHYAKHYQTGETIPQALIDKIDAAAKFNQGLGFGETLEAAMLDMKWHELKPADAAQDPKAFEQQALASFGLKTDLIPPRYRSPYFRHIWDNGYAAGYYSYIWTEMLAHDAWDWVVKHGGPTRANGDHVRDSFLGQGHTKDYAVMYRDYAGRDPQIQPMLEARGLVDETDKPAAR